MGRVFIVFGVLGIAAFLLWGLEGKTPYQYTTSDHSSYDMDSKVTPAVSVGSTKESTQEEGSMADQTAVSNNRKPSALGVKDYFTKTYGGNWETILSKEGKVVTLLGLVPEVGSSDDKVLSWGKQVAPLFSVAPEQISSVQEASESQFARHLYLSQKVGLFDVYNGGMQVSVKKEDGSIFQVNNSLREVGEFDRNIRLNQSQAWQVAEGIFREKVFRVDKNMQPVIHAEDGTDKTELAWVFRLRVGGDEFDEREVVIGAISGEVLENYSLVVH